MSQPMTKTESIRPGRAPRSPAARHVQRILHRLLPPTGPTPASISALAELRRGVGREPGTIPALWPWTMDGLESTAVGDRPSPDEIAVHYALTLFAVHQQSQSNPMHDLRRSFAQAVRLLADSGRGEQAVQDTPIYRRFMAMATAVHLEEVVVHARGIVGQLRADKIGFDYVALADDFHELARPWRHAVVQRRWSREFYSRSAPPARPESSTKLPTDEGE